MKKIILLFIIFFLFISLNNVYAINYINPLPEGSYSVISEYGMRIHPITGELKFHHGIDLDAPEGTEIYASNNGKANVYYNDSTAGNYIVITESEGNYTRYLHLSEILIEDGEDVVQGQIIGKVGNTGLSTGPHLHFEIVINGNSVNPLDYLIFENKPTLPENPIPLRFNLDNNHETGQITLYVSGYFPIKVYKSENNHDWELMATINSNYYAEYGLTNGKTYWYKIVDYYGREHQARYTPPITNINIYPLTLVKYDDTSAHFKWTEFSYGNLKLYLNDEIIYTADSRENEYTITGLKPNTTYQVYYKNYEHEISNKITFTTTDDISRLEQMLLRLFKPSDTDSNSDGIPDIIEPIKQKLDEIIDKIGGGIVDDVKDIIDNTENEFVGGNERLSDIPKIGFDYMGMQGNIFDVQIQGLMPFIEQIRNLVLIMLVVGFIYAILSLFNITWKV